MLMNRTELAESVEKGESETVEMKKSTSELKEAVISIVAMLNKHQRGVLYFGIADDRRIIGQDVGKDTLRDISRTIADSIEPRIYPEIKEDELGGKTIIQVNAEGREGLYYAYGRAYIRVGNENRLLSAKELEEIILSKK